MVVVLMDYQILSKVIKVDIELHCSRFTYEVAPVFNLMESVVLSRMYALLGWPEGQGDGVFAPGESDYVH